MVYVQGSLNMYSVYKILKMVAGGRGVVVVNTRED